MLECKKLLSILTGCLVGEIQPEKSKTTLHIQVRNVSISSLYSLNQANALNFPLQIADSFSPEPKMLNQKSQHLQTEEKVFDSPLLRKIVLKSLYTSIALLTGGDL